MERDKLNKHYETLMLLDRRGLPINLKILKHFQPKTLCEGLQMTGLQLIGQTDWQYVGYEEQGTPYNPFMVRNYVKDLVGGKNYLLFQDMTGQIRFDLPHFILLYNILKIQGVRPEILDKVLGASLLVNAKAFTENYAKLKKLKRVDDKFYVNTNCSSGVVCTSAPFLFQRWVLHFSELEGYKTYVFEPENLHKWAFLYCLRESIAPNVSLIEYRDKYIRTLLERNKTGSGLSTFLMSCGLPASVECTLQREMYSGAINVDGGMAKNIQQEYKKNTLDVTRLYKAMQEFMCRTMSDVFTNDFFSDIGKAPYLSPTDIMISHISPQRIAIIVRDGVSLETALPTVANKLKPIADLDFLNIFKGSEY